MLDSRHVDRQAACLRDDGLGAKTEGGGFVEHDFSYPEDLGRENYLSGGCSEKLPFYFRK